MHSNLGDLEQARRVTRNVKYVVFHVDSVVNETDEQIFFPQTWHKVSAERQMELMTKFRQKLSVDGRCIYSVIIK